MLVKQIPNNRKARRDKIRKGRKYLKNQALMLCELCGHIYLSCCKLNNYPILD